LRFRSKVRLWEPERTSDTGDMFSLLIFMAVIGAVDVLALRYGVDSRRDDGRKL
jgi:hypothetical protein